MIILFVTYYINHLINRIIGTPLVANIAVILMAMPTALNGSMLAMEYGGDTECMAQSIFLTTLMSIITIPVLAALL